jgi:hypothetical protein
MPVSGTPVTDALEHGEEKYAELEEAYVDLAKEADDLADEHEGLKFQYGSLLEQLKWTHAMLSILIEQQGGVVQVPKEVIENYGSESQIKVYEDIEGETYIIEIAFEEEDVT